MKRKIREFSQSRHGNFAIVAAVVLPALIMGVGIAVDVSLLINEKSMAQQAADAASLAGAREMTLTSDENKARQVAASFFTANNSSVYGVDQSKISVDIANSGSDTSVTVGYNGRINTQLMHIMGNDTTAYNVTSTSGFGRNLSLEVAMVLDVSQSMRGAELAQLKVAANKYIDALELEDGNPSKVVSVIPYANNVNLGSGFGGWKSTHYLHFDGCLEPDSDTNLRDASRVRTSYPDYVGGTGGGNKNPHCPPNSSIAQLHQTNPDSIKSRIKGMKIGYGTATDVATSWGWRTLHPNWKNKFPAGGFPKDFGDSKKVMIILTDGKIVRRNHTWKYTSNEVKNHSRPTKITEIPYTEQAKNNFDAMCNNLKNEGEIIVFTIGYSLSNTSDTDGIKGALRNCAVNGGQYFEADRINLQSAFDEIANLTRSIRLTN